MRHQGGTLTIDYKHPRRFGPLAWLTGQASRCKAVLSLAVPRDLRVKLQSTSGRVASAFEELEHERAPGRDAASGRIGAGTGRLRATSVSGHVALLRRAARRDELAELEAEISGSVHGLAREIREEVRGTVRDLKQELKQAAREMRREQRQENRSGRDQHGDQRWDWHDQSVDGRLWEFLDRTQRAIRRAKLTEAQVRECAATRAFRAYQRSI